MRKRPARCASPAGGGRRPCRWRGTPVLGCALVLAGLAGCSLISLKSPERPLSTRDLNARILTRELSAQFIAAVGRCAEDIATSEQEPAVLDNGLRWEIAAVAESRRAASRAAPMMSLLDTWALAVQMQAFTAAGAPGGSLFGAHQQEVRAVSDKFADDAQALARRLAASGEFADYQRFVAEYARAHPLQDLRFERASVVEVWSREKGAETKLVDTLGTIPQAMADASERVEMYGETVPSQVMRRTQLALREAGYSGNDLQASLRRLDERLAQLSTAAQSAPQLVHEAEQQVRQSMRDVLDRLDAATRTTTDTLKAERIALFSDLQAERVAVVAAVDTQRRALAADATRVGTQVAKESGEQVRSLAREVLLLLIVLSVVVLGLPFVAGYLVGRSRHGAP